MRPLPLFSFARPETLFNIFSNLFEPTYLINSLFFGQAVRDFYKQVVEGNMNLESVGVDAACPSNAKTAGRTAHLDNQPHTHGTLQVRHFHWASPVTCHLHLLLTLW